MDLAGIVGFSGFIFAINQPFLPFTGDNRGKLPVKERFFLALKGILYYSKLIQLFLLYGLNKTAEAEEVSNTQV